MGTLNGYQISILKHKIDIPPTLSSRQCVISSGVPEAKQLRELVSNLRTYCIYPHPGLWVGSFCRAWRYGDYHYSCVSRNSRFGNSIRIPAILIGIFLVFLIHSNQIHGKYLKINVFFPSDCSESVTIIVMAFPIRRYINSIVNTASLKKQSLLHRLLKYRFLRDWQELFVLGVLLWIGHACCTVISKKGTSFKFMKKHPTKLLC